MAYLRKKDTVYFLNGGQPVFSLVEKVAFRRYRSKIMDPKTGRKKMKSMPTGCEFLIPGYKLRNVTMKGDKILVVHTTYVAEFKEKYGNDWVGKMITEEQK